MSYVHKRKLKIPAFIALSALIILLLTGGYFIYTKFISPYPKEMLVKHKENSEVGKYKINKKVINDDYYVLHYPKTNMNELDTWIEDNMKNTIETYTESFKDEQDTQNEIKQLYKSYESQNQFTSVTLETYVNDTLTNTTSRTFDTNTQNFVDGRIFNHNGQRFVIDKLRQLDEKPKVEREVFLKETMIDDDFKEFYLEDKLLSLKTNFGEYTLNLEENADVLSEDLGNIKKGNEKNLPSVYLDTGYSKDEKMLAITFDDGPYSANTYDIMDIFEKHDAKASFFILGSRIAGEEDTVKAMLDRGHQVASHSYDHPDFNQMSLEDVKKQLDKTRSEIKRASGYTGEIYVRPPYGNILEETRRKLDYTFVNWSVDTNDWLEKDATKICNNTLNNAYDGSIILMHELYEATVQSLDCVLPKLKEQGYKIVTVKELLEAKGNDVLHGQLYFNAN